MLEMSIQEDVNNVIVTYDEKDNRLVKCFCGKICKISLVPHLKKEHPEKWEEWRLDFVRLKNKSWSYKRIMWKYRAIFSWSVINREIQRVVQDGKATLKTPVKATAYEWDPGFSLEKTTVWDFKNRGNWAVHRDDYRGNWPPEIPRNLILRYTHERDLVLDPFVGSGTTLIEAYLLRRRSIGIDLNPQAVRITEEKIEEIEHKIDDKSKLLADCRPIVIEGDAEESLKILDKMRFMKNKIDLVCAHPPYMSSIVYTRKDQDLSNLKNIDAYCEKMERIAQELFVLLKKGGICAVLIGDVRQNAKIVPLGFKVMNLFLKLGYTPAEIIIKIQHQDKSTQFYESKNISHYLLQHEYLLIFTKQANTA